MSRGRNQIEYTPPTTIEAVDSLRRAVAAGCDFILIDNRRQRWLWEAAEICVGEGLLEEGSLVDTDCQSSELQFRLTAKGRALGAP